MKQCGHLQLILQLIGSIFNGLRQLISAFYAFFHMKAEGVFKYFFQFIEIFVCHYDNAIYLSCSGVVLILPSNNHLNFFAYRIHISNDSDTLRPEILIVLRLCHGIFEITPPGYTIYKSRHKPMTVYLCPLSHPA